MNDYPLSWEEKNLFKFAKATIRTEYMLEGLVVANARPDEDATWTSWGTFDSLDDPLAQSRLAFLRDTSAIADTEQARLATNRILDYRILRREIATTEWEETDGLGANAHELGDR